MTAQELQSIYDNMPSDKKVAFTQMIEESVLPYISTSQYDIHEKVGDNELLFGWLEKELL